MAFSVSEAEWQALQDDQRRQDERIEELERQLDLQDSSNGAGAHAPAPADQTGTSEPTMDDRVDPTLVILGIDPLDCSQGTL